MITEATDRQRFVDTILAYPEWDVIIEFTKKRELITTTVIEPVVLNTLERRRRRRAKDAPPDGLRHIVPIRTKRRTKVLGEHTLDAIEMSARIENRFVPFVNRVNRARVAAMWCVEDYHDKDAHPALFLGHLRTQKGDIIWREALDAAARHADLHIGRVTAWSEQDDGGTGLARYLLKSIDPRGFSNPEHLLATSSGTWGMRGLKSELFSSGEVHANP